MKTLFYTAIFTGLAFCLIQSACKTAKTQAGVQQQKMLDITPVPAPVDMGNMDIRFYKDIRYDQYKETAFDLFMPASKEAVPLVIYIHGGGFIDGDKAKSYTTDGEGQIIKGYLSNNIAFASINYRLLSDDDQAGVLKCLNDCKRALQFIRYYASFLNIDKDNILLMGASAGAGASLWLGLQDDLADKNNPDPVLRESTRVKGIVAIETQCSYDILNWHNTVFKEYQSQGLDLQYIRRLGTDQKMLRFLGISSLDNIDPEAAKEFRRKLNMLDMMDKNDPEIYAANTRIPYSKPTRTGELNHHPLHVKALMDRAAETNLKGSFYIPKMNIDTRGGEKQQEFVLRLLGN